MTDSAPTYTNGYSGTYDISIPNYLASGTGISVVFYLTNTSTSQKLFSSTNYANSNSIAMALNNSDSGGDAPRNTQYIQYTGEWMDSDISDSLTQNAWNQITIYKNLNGTLTFTSNGTSVTATEYVSYSTFIFNLTNLILASIAYTSSPTVSYPFNEDPNVTSYIDLANPTNPKIYGDESQFTITGNSLTSSTVISNVPDIEITHVDDSGDDSSGGGSNTNVFGETTISDSSSLGNSAVLMGGGHISTINDNFEYVQKITPTGLNARQINDKFGSITTQGDGFLAVGVPLHSYSVDGTTSITNTGAVWIFREQSDGTWLQETKLGLSENNVDTQFGYSVFGIGSDLYVGCPYYDYDSTGANEADDAGAVFHYTYDSSEWTLKEIITASGINGRNPNDLFGYSITGDSSNLFIGAPGHQYDSSGASALDQAGAVFHFTLADTSWSLSEKIVGMGPSPRSIGDNFGSNVVFDSVRLLIQAKGYKFDSQGSNSVTGAGAIFIINYTTGSPVYEARLVSNNRTENLNFGSIIDINFNSILVSGMTNRFQEEFVYDGTNWTEMSNFNIIDLVPDSQVDVSPTGLASIINPSKTLSTGPIGTGDFTLETWIYYDGMAYNNDWDILQSNNSYVNGNPGGESTNGKDGFTLLINGYSSTDTVGRIHFVCLETRYKIAAIPTSNALSHIAVVRQNGIMTFYLNGVKISSVANTSNFSDTTGFKVTTPQYTTGGYIKSSRISTSALYTANFTPPAELTTDDTGLYLFTFTKQSTGTPSSVTISPYSDNSTVSCSFNNSYGTITQFIESPKNTAVLSFWTMYDDDKIINTSKYPMPPLIVDSIITNQAVVVPSSSILSYMNNLLAYNLDATTMAASDINHYVELGFDTTVLSGTRAPIRTGKWYHITVTFGSGISDLYVDGKWFMSASYDTDITTKTSFVFGDTSYSNVQYFSDIRYYADKLIVNGDFSPPTTAYDAVSSISSQSNCALYVNDYVAIGDTTIEKSNQINRLSYTLDQTSSGGFAIGSDLLVPGGRISVVKSGKFGNKVKVSGNKIAIQAPADSTDLQYNQSVPMAGALYTFDISTVRSSGQKIVSGVRGINSLYFGDDFTIDNSGDLTVYSPRTQYQISSVYESISDWWTYGTYYVMTCLLSSGIMEKFTEDYTIGPMDYSSSQEHSSASARVSPTYSYSYSVTPSMAITTLINTDYTAGISYNYSTAATAYTGYLPTLAAGSLASYATPTQASVNITSPGTTNARNTNQYYGYSITQSDSKIFIGAPGSLYNSYGSPAYGSVFVINDSYDQLFSITTTNSSLTSFGYHVESNGSKLLVGNTKQASESALLYDITDDTATLDMTFGVYTTSNTDTSLSIWPSQNNVGIGTSNTILDGNNVAFGLYGATNGATGAGSAIIASSDSGSWSTEQLSLSGLVNARFANDSFGSTVVLDSNIAVIGAPGHDYQATGASVPSGTSGAIYTYSYDMQSDNWSAVNILTAPAGCGITNFGSTLDLKSGTIVSSNNSSTSYSYVIMSTSDGITWSSSVQTCGTNTSNTGTYAGSVALMSSTHAIIGTPKLSWPTNANVGGFYDSQLSGTTWTMPNMGSSWTEGYGYSNGLYRIPLHTNGRLETKTIDYSLLATNGRLAGDGFGTSVAISPDGKLAAVGIPNCHINITSRSASYYGGLNVFYFDTVQNKWRFQSRQSEADSTTPSTTGVGATIEFYDDTHIVAGGKSFGTTGILRYITLSGTSVNDSVSNYLTNYYTGPASSTGLGTSLSISGNNLYFGMPSYPAYGSWGESTTTDGVTWDASQTTSSTVHTIDGIIDVRNANDKFGTSVEVKDNRFWIGAPYSYTDTNGSSIATNTGSVYVYEYDTELNEKVFVEKLLPATYGSSYFGMNIKATDSSVIISGNYSGSTNQAIALYNYTPGGTSTLITSIGLPSNMTTTSSWATSISLMDDQHIVIGVPSSNTVEAITLDSSGNNVAEQDIQPSMISKSSNREYSFGTQTITGQLFGETLSSGDGFIAVGIPGWNQNYKGTYYTSGAVAIYSRNSSGEYDIEAILLDDYINGDSASASLGTSISADGDTVVIGTPSRITNAGGFLIYRRNSDGLWDLTTSKRFEEENIYMGKSVAVQGEMMVAGAPCMGGTSNQTSIADSGLSYVYTNSTGSWTSLDYKSGDTGSWYPTNASSSYNAGTSKLNTYAGGAGSGALGGSTYFINYLSNPGGGAGTNLVPSGGSSQIGTLNTPPNSSDADIGQSASGGVTSTTIGGNGGDARVVIYTDNTPTYFDYTGSDQYYVVPDNVSTITVKLWGAGGGAGYNVLGTATTSVGLGGAGSYVTGTLDVTPGESLTIVVGQGGLGGNSYSDITQVPAPAYGGGGLGGSNGLSDIAGSGGGRAEILRGETSLAIAGGGGGGASIVTNYDTMSIISNGVPGGYELPTSCIQGTILSVDGNVNTRNANDYFGSSISQISDTQLAIGAPGHSFGNSGQAIPANSGAVMFYTKNSTRWNYDYRMNSSSPTASQYFGSSISTNGTTLAVEGGPFNYNFTYSSGSMSYNVSPAGSYYETFVLNGNQWVSNGVYATDTTNLFNNITLIDDTKIVAGEYKMTSTATTPIVSNSGGFITFDLSGTDWSITSENVAPGMSFGRQAGDNFGTQVYMGSGWVAASAPNHSYSADAMTNIAGRGAAFVFHQDISTGDIVYENKLFNDISNSGYNGSGTFMTYAKGTLSLISTNSSGTFLSNWTRTNNQFTNMTYGSTDITSISAVAAMDQNRFMTGRVLGSDFNGVTTGYWNFYPSNSTIYTDSYNDRIVVPGYQNGRMSDDAFGTGVALLDSSNIIAVTAPGQAYTESGSKLSNPGAVYTYYIPTGSADNKYVYEDKIYNTGSQAISMTNIDSKSTSILVYGSSSAGLYSRIKIGSWSLVNSVSNPALLSATLVSPNEFGVGQSTSYSDTETASVAESGSALFYQNNSNTWTVLPTLYANGLTSSRQANDKFGSSIVMNSNYVMVGAPGHTLTRGGISFAPNNGAIWIYSRIGSSLEVIDMVVSPSLSSASDYGQIISIADDNSYYAVGSPAENTVYVFQFDGLNSTLVSRLVPTTDMGTVTSSTMFGASVAIQNEDLLIGIPGMTDGTSVTGGIARYENDNGVWNYVGLLSEFNNSSVYDSDHPEQFTAVDVTTPEGDILGAAVALNSERGALFGATGNQTDITGENQVTGAGAAWFKYLG